MSLTLYRRCKLGETLVDSVNELKKNNKITESLGESILEAFDKIMCEEISKRQKNKCTIKGVVKNYKNCDDIWIFYAENVFLRSDCESFTSEKLKVVACDAQMKTLYDDRRTQKKESNNNNNNNNNDDH